MNKRKIEVRTFADLAAEGKTAEYLYWVGSACSYDDRAKKISRDFVRILEHAKVDYAVLGLEETDSGDVAKRSGNEFLFQMQAMQIIEMLNTYGIRKVITTDPHDFNLFKNEYPDLGGQFQVWHHSQFIQQLASSGKLKLAGDAFQGKRVTFHDPCYLGRGNGEYEAPRGILSGLGAKLVEMERSRSRSMCCGAGGAQMFKEPEKGKMEVNALRTQQALETQPQVIATGCPFCMTMMSDGIKYKDLQTQVEVLDLAEIVSRSLKLAPTD